MDSGRGSISGILKKRKVIQEGEKITGSKNVKKDDEIYGEVRPKVIKKRGSYSLY